MKLQEMMTTNVITIDQNNTALEASKIMQAHNIGFIPVCSGDNKVLGVITDRDIVVRCIANNGNPATTPIQNLMTTEVVYGQPTMDGDEAASLMAQHKIRRLPVVQNDKLIGIVAIGDLATRYRLTEEAGQALSEISEPSRPANLIQ